MTPVRSTLLRLPLTTVERDDAASVVRSTIEAWIARKLSPFKVAWDGGPFTHPMVLVDVAHDPESRRYAFTLWHRDDENPTRAWTVELSTEEVGNAVRLDTRLSVAHDANDRRIVIAPPRFLRDIGVSLGYVDGSHQLSPEPSRLTASSAVIDAFADFIDSPDRRLPVLGVSEPESFPAGALASALYPLAHVVVIENAATYELTDRYGRASSVFGGAIRLYPPGWRMADPPQDRSALVWLADGIRFGRPFDSIAIRRIVAELSALYEGMPVLSPRFLANEVARRDADRKRAAREPEPAPIPLETIEAPVELTVTSEDLTAPSFVELEAELDFLREEVALLSESLAQARDDAAKARRDTEEWEALASAYEREKEDALARLSALDSTTPTGLTDGLSPASAALLTAAIENLRNLRERLLAGDAAEHDAAQYRREADELRRERFYAQQGTQDEPPPAADTPRKIPYDWQTYDTLAAYLREHYGDAIVLHPRVARTLKDGVPSNLEGLFDVLDALATDYHESKRGDADARARWLERMKPYKVAKALTATGSGSYRSDYEVTWNGRRIDATEIRHVREHGTDWTGRIFAVYYFFDEEGQQVVVTSMPRHLWTNNAHS